MKRKISSIILLIAILTSLFIPVLSVTASAEETTVEVTIKDYASSNNWVNGTQYPTVNVDSNIAATAEGGGNTGKYYTSGNEWRLYQTDNATLTISAAEGCTISSVKITYNVNNSGVLKLSGSNVTSGTEVIVGANSVTFSVGNSGSKTNGQVKVTKISVTYTTAATPTPPPSSCAHTNTTTTTTKDATCTEDGSKTVTCKDCGETLPTESIPATGHNSLIMSQLHRMRRVQKLLSNWTRWYSTSRSAYNNSRCSTFP